MNLYTISAPIQLVICGFGIQIGAEMALAHALAMFAPGFITGRLVERFGSVPVIVAGVALNSGCVACALSGTTVLPFLGGEVLSGLGWNLMFTGATTMLSRAHGHDERVRAQAANDVVISATLVSTSIAAGVLHSAIGWAAVIIAAALLILIGLVAVIWRLPPPMAPEKAKARWVNLEHRQSRYLNNSAKNSHRPTRRRGRRCNASNRPNRRRTFSPRMRSSMATSIDAAPNGRCSISGSVTPGVDCPLIDLCPANSGGAG